MSSEIIKYKTGEILCEKNVVEDKPMYKIEKATWFSNKGEIRCEESYENGLKEGLCTYYKNGKIFVQGSYSHGYKDGKWIKIDEESGERIETNYSDGFKDGTEIIHLRDGRIIEDKFDSPAIGSVNREQLTACEA